MMESNVRSSSICKASFEGRLVVYVLGGLIVLGVLSIVAWVYLERMGFFRF